MGKGSARRPPAVTDRELADRWAAVFRPRPAAPPPPPTYRGDYPEIRTWRAPE